MTDVRYAPFGPIEAMDVGNGIEASFTLDADYRVTAVTHGGWNWNHVRDAAGNVTQDGLPGDEFERSYDALSRLTMAVTYQTGTITEGYYYHYDGNGNRTAKEQCRKRCQVYFRFSTAS